MKLFCLLALATAVLGDGDGHHGDHHGAHHAEHHTDHKAPHPAPHHGNPVQHPVQHRARPPVPHHAVAHRPLNQRQPLRRFPVGRKPAPFRRPLPPRPRFQNPRLINKPRPARSHLPLKPGQLPPHPRPQAPGRVPARPPPRAKLPPTNLNSLASSPVGPTKTKDVSPSVGTPPTGTKSLKVLLEENEHFSTLLTALKAADMLETLAGKGPFTIFAPTNSAFDKVEINALNALMSDKAKLKETLLRHVVPGANIEGKAVPDGTFKLKTAGGDSITTNRGKFVQVSTSKGKGFVVKFDFPASNGVYHAVDHVL